MPASFLWLGVVVMAIVCPTANGQDVLNCGQEYRFEMRDGAIIQGRLKTCSGDSLVLHSGRFRAKMLFANDIFDIYRVRRKTGTGVIVGALFGTLVGGLAAAATDNRGGNMFDEMDSRIEDGIGVTLTGTLIGGVIGGLLGRRVQRLGPVNWKSPEICFNNTRGVTGFGAGVVIEF
jgi:hypothetical protein